MYLLSPKVSLQSHLSVNPQLTCLLNRKIRCNGGEPCANCAKTGRNCDYTPVPADANAPRRRRAFEDNVDVSMSQKEQSREGSLASRTGGRSSTVGESTQPAGSFATGANGSVGMVDPNGYLAHPTGVNDNGMLSSGFSYVPPSHGAQQMEWALVPVWRSTVPEQEPQQLLAAPSGFAASRMPESIHSITIPQPSLPTVQAQTTTQDYPRSASTNTGPYHPQATPGQQGFGRVFGFAVNQTEGMVNMSGLDLALSRAQPVYNRATSEEPRYNDTAFSMSDMGVPVQQPCYPLASPATGTPFSSSRDFGSNAPPPTGNQSLSSPPYTPLPSSSNGIITSRPSTGNPALGHTMEDMKQMYPPMMFMHMPPVTPAFDSPNNGPPRANMMAPDAAMVGLGIMMPGM